jgi:hypothetical protein
MFIKKLMNIIVWNINYRTKDTHFAYELINNEFLLYYIKIIPLNYIIKSILNRLKNPKYLMFYGKKDN